MENSYPEWLLRRAEEENGCCISVGGLADHLEQMQKNELILAVAMNIVLERKKACDEGPDEPWAFHAAEQMMTEWEYTDGKIMDEGQRIAKEFENLSPETIRALVQIYENTLTDTDVERKPAEPPKVEPAPTNDEIPF